MSQKIQILEESCQYSKQINVLIGVGLETRFTLDLLFLNKVEIHYLCDNNKDNIENVINGIPVITFSQLQQIAKFYQNKNTNIVVQIIKYNNDNAYKKELSKIKVDKILSLYSIFDNEFNDYVDKQKFNKLKGQLNWSRNEIENLRCAKRELDNIKNSKSYKLALLITWLPRKINKLIKK